MWPPFLFTGFGTANLTAPIRWNAGIDTYTRHRFATSISRDIEDMLAERGITLSYESIRRWCIKFDRKYARRLERNHHGYVDTFFIDEVFVKINGKQQLNYGRRRFSLRRS